jgi:hypothetical protein
LDEEGQHQRRAGLLLIQILKFKSRWITPAAFLFGIIQMLGIFSEGQTGMSPTQKTLSKTERISSEMERTISALERPMEKTQKTFSETQRIF